MSEGCYHCGVRADIGCKHRPAEGAAPLAIAEPLNPKDERRKARVTNGNGLNFRARRD